ncbi:MAG: hypothetical protein KF713_12575 [Turneriella sp.]|nr:hypothetical protein [Turneriella sp.]
MQPGGVFSSALVMIRRLSVLIILALFTECGGVALEQGAITKEALVKNFVAALSQGDHATVRQYLVRKKEFVEGIHPYTPEAKNIGGELWWNDMLVKKRDVMTTALMDKFAGKTCSVEISGKEKKVEKYGPITFYRQIPVRIVCGDRENLYTDEDKSIFGVVVEKNGIYKVLNIFND